MDTRAFFGRVLADQPNHVLTLGAIRAGKKIFWNENYSTLDDAAAGALKHDNKGHTTYHAIGSFNDNVEGTKVSRKAVQATTFKTLACDIDVGDDKPYPTQLEAAKALAQACKATGIPVPMLVSSGYGLHCYWPLELAIDTGVWVAMSTALRDVFQNAGLQLDASKVCDPAMVLRPVGTTNRKGEHSLTVQLLRDCPDYPASTFAGLVRSVPAPRRAVGVPATSPMLAAVLERDDLPLADPVQLVQKCGQLAHVAATRGDVPEPLWYLALGVANHCVDVEAVAIRWSDGHPDYTEKATLAKLQQWKANTTGPATCVAFEKVNPDTCKKCLHYGKINTPVQLSVPVPEPTPNVELPSGYQLSKGRILWVIDGVATPVCNFPLVVKERKFDVQTGKSVATLEARMPVEGVKLIELPIDILAAGKEKWTGFLFNNSIAPGPTEKHITGTRRYLMTYLEELQSKSKPTDTYSRFGWVEDQKAFVLGTRLFSAKGVVNIELAQSVSQEMRVAYESKGELKEWIDVARMYGTQGLECHAMCLLMGLGAPLLAFTDLDGIVISMYSPQSGTGKTTTGHLINSIWGNPKTIQIGRNDTMNAMYHTLVQQCNLPAYFEEVTNIGGPELSDFVYNVAHGRERRRLNEKAALRESGKWKLPVFTSTNRSLISKLQNNKLSSEGELQRIIEYPFVANRVFSSVEGSTPTGMLIAATLRQNYGLAGPIFLNAICRMPNLSELVVKAYAAMQKEFDFEFDAKERYIQAAHVIAYIAGKIGTKLNIIPFDYHPIIAHSLKYLRNVKQEVVDAAMDGFDVVGLFTIEHTHATIYERTDTSMTNPRPHQNTSNLRGEIRARFEVIHNNKGVLHAGQLYIDRAYFNRWCQERGIDVSDVMDKLKNTGVLTNVLRVALGRRTTYMTASTYCYQIDLTHPELVGRLSGIDTQRESMCVAIQGGKVE